MTAKSAPKKLSARDAAEQIGTDPKTLRRFLRANDSYSNPGSGGHYEFVQKDIAPMKRAFTKWLAEKPTRKAPASKSTRKPASESAPKTVAKKTPTQTRAAKKDAANKRVDALEASLKSSGKHISQHSDK